jgi:hypothetical protein
LKPSRYCSDDLVPNPPFFSRVIPTSFQSLEKYSPLLTGSSPVRPDRENFRPSGVDVMIIIFCEFCHFSATKKWRSSQKSIYDQFFAKTISSLSKNANIFAKKFSAKLLLKPQHRSLVIVYFG